MTNSERDELLVRIDERVGFLYTRNEEGIEKDKEQDIRISCLEKEKVSKKSISYLLGLIGGSLTIVLTIVTIVWRLASI